MITKTQLIKYVKDGLSNVEIAELTDTPRATVRRCKTKWGIGSGKRDRIHRKIPDDIQEPDFIDSLRKYYNPVHPMTFIDNDPKGFFNPNGPWRCGGMTGLSLRQLRQIARGL